MSETTAKSESVELESDENATAVEAITERLSEVTELAEELDQALRSAQQDCAISPAAVTLPIPIITGYTKYTDGATGTTDEDVPSTSKPLRVEDIKSDDEFLTASDCTLQHSRSSSYNTASESEQMYAPWWNYGKDDVHDDIYKEKMVLAVGLPELPLPKDVLKPSPEAPPGKIAREVTETTHIKVQQSHTFGVKSFVLTSEMVREKKHEGFTCKDDDVVVIASQQNNDVVIPIEVEGSTDDELLERMREVGTEDWKNYTYATKQALKGCF